jgi:hypothetical protein
LIFQAVIHIANLEGTKADKVHFTLTCQANCNKSHRCFVDLNVDGEMYNQGVPRGNFRICANENGTEEFTSPCFCKSEREEMHEFCDIPLGRYNSYVDDSSDEENRFFGNRVSSDVKGSELVYFIARELLFSDTVNKMYHTKKAELLADPIINDDRLINALVDG